MGIQFWKSPLPVTVAQPSRLRVLAASRRQFGKRAPGRCPNPQAGRLRYFAVHEQALGTMEPAIGAPVSDPASWQAIASNEPRRCSALRSCGSRPVSRSKRNMRLPLNLKLIRAIAVALAPRVPLGVPVSRSGPLKTPSKGAIRGPTPAVLQTVFIRGSGAFFPPRPLRLCARPGLFF